jgi:fructoselysine-6-P-deglycase FrlB-like protein
MTATYIENVAAVPGTLRAAAEMYATAHFDRALDEAASLLRDRAVTSTGMGASFFALTATRASLDPALRLHWIDETGYLDENVERISRPLDALLAVSQSGETVEARKLLPKLGGVPQVLVTRDVDSSLARQADVVLPQHCPADLSVSVQTYVTQIAVLELLAARVARRETEPLLADLRSVADSAAVVLDTLRGPIQDAAVLLSDADQIYALGRGNSVASALGTGLLFKEAAKRDCEGMSSAQFRHGGVEVVSARTAALIFAGGEPDLRRLDENLARELVSYGSQVVVVTHDDFAELDGVTVLRLPPGPASMRRILEILPSELMAYDLAERNNVVAGEFHNTVPVIVSA